MIGQQRLPENGHPAPEFETRPAMHRSHNDRQTVIALLNDALAMELECVLRYRRHHFAAPGAGGIAGYAIAAELLKHSQEELAHADGLAARITRLGGVPVFTPRHPENPVEHTFRGMLMEDLVAERSAIDTYSRLVRCVADSDPTTRRLLEDLLAQEETHAGELEDFLKHLAISG